ncbi:YusW family protein [Sutcliffiella horikoshii]|uniref:YusW family protein n=1 Tax=Sutcliffiella horikoshii TaxID=79883 RepID=UPI00203FFA1A|nr:YusW family protein [Sutcliffiella horikoshii]MCM3617157.1 YusW family protein [Sutcliffiella horikoshii]
MVWSRKKHIPLIMSLILTSGIVAGCGTNNDLSAPPENAPAQNDGTGTEETNQGTTTGEEGAMGHDFTKFDLEVEYENNVKYEAEYEAEGNGEADIEDDLNDVSIKGDEAYAELSPLLEQLNIDSNSDDQDVMSQVLEVFGLQDDYKEFELEITFGDGTKKKYEEKR